jgi:hypothetical protein
VWVNAFEVGKDGLTVEAVAVGSRMGKHIVGDRILVVADELGTASRALLFVPHDAHSKSVNKRRPRSLEVAAGSG